MGVVTEENFFTVLSDLSSEKFIAVDTETTGLYPYRGDTLFSIILAGAAGAFYFNFEDYGDGSPCLHDEKFWAPLRDFFKQNRLWIFQNSKFDLAFLRKEGIEVHGEIHDTKTAARLLWNDHLSYSLKDLVVRAGLGEKSDAVEDYVKKHGLFEMVDVPYKAVRDRKVRYHEVPFPIISSYGLRDGEITYALGVYQLEKIRLESSPSSRHRPLSDVYSLEKRLLPVIFEMESLGIQIDRDYCARAIKEEEQAQKQAITDFTRLTGRPFLDSNKLFREVFDGKEVPQTEKGNPSFDKKSLGKMAGDEIAASILRYREAKNQANFFHGFLHHSGADGRLHTNFLADGTASGRFSSANPNLQNLTRPSEGEKEGFEVRGAIIPRPGFILFEFDYKSQEYMHMLELAEAKELIPKVKAGLDIHQATADLVGRGMTRQQAKTLNFALAYGAGPLKIAEMLRISQDEARTLRSNYFKAIPSVARFLSTVIDEAQIHGKVHNWKGRIFRFPDHKFSYKAPNYKIQGGCADITKTAIVNVAQILRNKKSRIILTVHDSIVLEVEVRETHIIPEIKKIMEEAYPARHLPLKVSIDYSRKNLSETTEWTGSEL